MERQCSSEKDQPAYTTEESSVSTGSRSKPGFRRSGSMEVLKHQHTIKEESRRYSISSDTQPWLAEDGRTVTWSLLRIQVAKIIRHQAFEAIMAVVIVFNLFMIIYETDHEAQCYPPGPEWENDPQECPYKSDKVPWIKWTNLGLLLTYSFEAVLRLYVEHLLYFQNRWNILDFSVVCTGWLSEALGGVISLAFLRIFRIARLSRAFRIVLSIRELYMLITGLGSSMKSIFYGMFLLFGMLTLWGIVLVDFVHPINSRLNYDGCTRCSKGFASVTQSVLTLFQQIVAGDSWGLLSVPIIEESPVMAVILFAVLLSVSLGVMNLILAVIVESAAEARENDIEHKTKHKLNERRHQKMELLKIFSDLDKDLSDSVSLEEMQQAWDDAPRFRNVMEVLEVGKDELEVVFNLLDTDGSGEVDYKEFVDRLYALRTCDVRLKLEHLNTCLAKHVEMSHQRHQEHDMKIERQLQLLTSINNKIIDLSYRDSFSKPASKADVRGGHLLVEPLNGSQKRHSCSKKKPLLTKASSPRGDEFALDFVDGAESGALAQEGRKIAPMSADAYNPQLEFNPQLDFGTQVSFQEWKVSAVPVVTEVTSGLGQLQQHIEKLAAFKVDIVRKAEEQAQALRRHSSTLTSVQGALVQGSMGSNELHTFAETIYDLQRHVQQRLALIVLNLKGIIDEDEIDLATTAALIEALRSHANEPLLPTNWTQGYTNIREIWV